MATEKRFTHKEDDWEIMDNGEHLAYAHSDYQAEKICELLNELNNEVKSQSLVIKGYQERTEKLFNENEQLKDALNQRTDQCDKYYKENEQLKSENQEIRDTIKEMYETERTDLGKSTLKQLLEAIQ